MAARRAWARHGRFLPPYLLRRSFCLRWQDGASPVYIASQEGNADVVGVLIGARADIEATGMVDTRTHARTHTHTHARTHTHTRKDGRTHARAHTYTLGSHIHKHTHPRKQGRTDALTRTHTYTLGSWMEPTLTGGACPGSGGGVLGRGGLHAVRH